MTTIKAFLLLITFLVLSCGSEVLVQNANYYFQPMNFGTEKTYCFTNQNNDAEKSYWIIKSEITPGDTLLRTTVYNNERLIEKYVERVNNGSSKLISYVVYNGETAEAIDSSACSIIDSLTYSSALGKNDEIKWKVYYKDFNTNNKISLSKSRKLKSSNEKMQVYLDKVIISVLGSRASYEYSIKSVFEKDKGLTHYYISQPEGKSKDYILTSVN